MAKILIIGEGGREHALAWKISRSELVDEVYVAPGNGGTFMKNGKIENVPIQPTWIKQLLKFAKEQKIDLTVVGTEKALAVGIADYFKGKGLRIFGPSLRAAKIETSKIFAKKLLEKAGIPTAPFLVFYNRQETMEHIISKKCRFPIVIKQDGLAAGKGVQVCGSAVEAVRFVQETTFPLLIEDFLEGPELSAHVLCDGRDLFLWPLSKDYKTIFENNEGLNTGGMGSYAPVGKVDNGKLLVQLRDKIIEPLLRGMTSKDRNAYIGCLYPGLKVTPKGIMVLEFNARFGDPEFQSYARLLKTDLFEILMACVKGRLSEVKIEWEQKYAVCVVLASQGYPGKYKIGYPIAGIEEAKRIPEVIIFHAGTAYENGYFVTTGGRVLNVTATGETLQEARKRAYEAVSLISFEGMQCRGDIAEL